MVTLCECGCGEPIAPADNRGRPRRFVRGHGRRGAKLPPEEIARRTATRLDRGGGVYLRTGWKQPNRPTADERFDNGYRVDEASGCWRWTGSLKNGYGRLSIDGREVYAHRFSHERFIGPIPDGYDVDHVRGRGCDFSDCVNPSHLEAVTHRENVRRALMKDRCIRGHKMTGDNVRIRSSGRGRVCRACHRERNREAKRRRSAA